MPPLILLPVVLADVLLVLTSKPYRRTYEMQQTRMQAQRPKPLLPSTILMTRMTDRHLPIHMTQQRRALLNPLVLNLPVMCL